MEEPAAMSGKATTTRNNVARGAILGALIGDAAGGTLEFLGRTPTPHEVDKAMQLVGGGIFDLAPGQFTDDGEMTVTLLRALNANSAVYHGDQVALAYFSWANSDPFDIGKATSQALAYPMSGGVNYRSISSQAIATNSESKANGSLMRAAPLGILGAKLSLDDTIKLAHKDAALTHPNQACLASTAAYVIALRHLMLQPFDSFGAINAAETYLAQGCPEVMSWLQDAKAGLLPEAEPLIGYVRIAFTHAFFHLYQSTSYESALKTTLAMGGDTDTNACIVGGLVGAHLGYDQLPEHLIRTVTKCDTAKGQHRPRVYSSENIVREIDDLVEHVTTALAH
uniref:ADP-ribosylglycohydrolase family protein n=1 Tax=Flavobacterium sp. TaxID=239 RepID=UPI004048DFFB